VHVGGYLGTAASGSGGAVQIANGSGNALDSDGGNFVYQKSTSRLQIANLYAFNELDVGANLRLLYGTTGDGSIPFLETRSAYGFVAVTANTDWNWDNTNKYLNLGTASGSYRLNVISSDSTIASPTSFSATLASQNLAAPCSGGITNVIYGPQDPTGGAGSTAYYPGSVYTAGGQTNPYTVYAYRNDLGGGVLYASPFGDPFYVTDTVVYPIGNGSDNGSIENPLYSGYTNNDTVSAVVYPYINISGTNYVSTAPFYLPTITLLSNPSGIDWNWNAASNSDSSAPTGYIIVITDQTTSTTYSYDVGNVLTYADMNSGGTASYQIGIPISFNLNWSAATNGDGTPVDGYIVYSSNGGNSYDVGNTTSFTDIGVTNTVTMGLLSS